MAVFRPGSSVQSPNKCRLSDVYYAVLRTRRNCKRYLLRGGMKILAVILIPFLLMGCKKSAEKITSTSVNVYLNQSNCSIYEKVMSGSLANHQIVIMQAPALFSLIQAQKAEAELINFYLETYAEKGGILSREEKETLARLQSDHIACAQMTVAQQKFVTDLVFKACTEK